MCDRTACSLPAAAALRKLKARRLKVARVESEVQRASEAEEREALRRQAAEAARKEVRLGRADRAAGWAAGWALGWALGWASPLPLALRTAPPRALAPLLPPVADGACSPRSFPSL